MDLCSSICIQNFFLKGKPNPRSKRPQVDLFSLHPQDPRGTEAIRLKKRFCYLQKYLDTCSAVPMGFSLSKSATQVSAMRIDSKVEDHLMRGTEESRLEPVTQLFQNTTKIRIEEINQGNFTRSEETGMGSLSVKALGSVAYVKESDGIEMTDVE